MPPLSDDELLIIAASAGGGGGGLLLVAGVCIASYLVARRRRQRRADATSTRAPKKVTISMGNTAGAPKRRWGRASAPSGRHTAGEKHRHIWDNDAEHRQRKSSEASIEAMIRPTTPRAPATPRTPGTPGTPRTPGSGRMPPPMPVDAVSGRAPSDEATKRKQEVDAPPPGWKRFADHSGVELYVNSETGESTWERPNSAMVAAAGGKDGLPAGWMSLRNDCGQTYYHHAESNMTSWERPSSTLVQASSKSAEPFARIADSFVEDPLPLGWKMLSDDEGGAYYYNPETGTTSWERPASTTDLYGGRGGAGGPATATERSGASLWKSMRGSLALRLASRLQEKGVDTSTNPSWLESSGPRWHVKKEPALFAWAPPCAHTFRRCRGAT